MHSGHPSTKKGLAALLGRFLSEDYFPGRIHASAAFCLFPPFLESINDTFVFVLGDLEEARLKLFIMTEKHR